MELMGYFDWLPTEIKREVLFPQLDSLSRIVLRHIIRKELPPTLSGQDQVEAHHHSLDYFWFFFRSGLLDRRNLVDCLLWHDNVVRCYYADEYDLIEWARENIWVTREVLLMHAVSDKRIQWTEILVSAGLPITDDIIEKTIMLDSAEILKIIYPRPLKENKFNLIAAGRGKLKTLKWFHQIGLVDVEAELKEAVNGGQLEVIKWLDCWRDPRYYIIIAESSRVSIIQWLYQQDPSRKKEMFSYIRYSPIAEWLARIH